MKFLDDNLYLENTTAQRLYYDIAKDLPIIDYHSHLNPSLILEDKQYKNITELWLSGDHYKWRLMRACGVNEKYITGNGDDYSKFLEFAKILPLCIGNPIYIWCHLELKKYFGYNGEINEDTAKEIFDLSQKVLAKKEMSVQGIIKKSGVKIICTTDDPADNLQAHKQLLKSGFDVQILPTFRPDRALNIADREFAEYTQKLGSGGLTGLKAALSDRLNYFISSGCVITDHALKEFLFAECSETEAEIIFNKAIAGEKITTLEEEKYKTHMLMFLAELYNKNNLVMQLHFNCLRNNNSIAFKTLGADSGYDCINISANPHKLAAFLDALYTKNILPKTIIYSLNPGDNRIINSVINCFQGKGRGWLQHGAAWWFNDTKKGIQEHLCDLSEYGVLGNFIGMLTDSRSFTSFVRHDFFRRLLCNFIAERVDSGEYPDNIKYIRQLIEGICYTNIKEYPGL